MAEITSSMIKELRERTQAGMLDCKKALTETNGDLDQAADFLRKKGLASAGKRAGRDAKEGVVVCTVAEDKKSATMLELNCETDFVAKNEDFQTLAGDVLKKVAESDAKSAEDLPSDLTDMVKEAIAKTGENTTIGRFMKFAVDSGKNGIISTYIHSNNKIGVMVQLSVGSEDAEKSADLAELGKDIAMQAAAAMPQYLNETEVPADVITREKEIYFDQMKDSGKPQQILEKIVEGKLRKFYTDVCLVDQVFIKDNSKTIKSLIKEYSGKIGSDITVDRYFRVQIGS